MDDEYSCPEAILLLCEYGPRFEKLPEGKEMGDRILQVPYDEAHPLRGGG